MTTSDAETTPTPVPLSSFLGGWARTQARHAAEPQADPEEPADPPPEVHVLESADARDFTDDAGPAYA
uniref:hypothetical protein n=1 Tax=Actinomyces sp. 186855 TaxID=2761164 RepID=UPI0020300677